MDALKAGAAGSDDDDDEPGQNLYAGGVGRGGGGSGQVFSNKQISLKNSFPRDHAPCAPARSMPGLSGAFSYSFPSETQRAKLA
jgi:hypothetical protein